MGEEIRAFNNLNWYRATGDAPFSLIGLNGYGPNLNIARDPRYGRTSEVPGEDPFLTGSYAVAMTRGGQGLDEYENGKSKFLKMTLGLKHYDLYSVEVTSHYLKSSLQTLPLITLFVFLFRTTAQVSSRTSLHMTSGRRSFRNTG